MSGTILFVDDAANWYEAVSNLLEDEEYTVIWAKTKVDAMSKMKAHNIDLVITNLNLKPNFPVLDGEGYSLLELLKEECPDIPRIVLSALREPESASAMAEKVAELYSYYKVRHVAIKGGDKFSNKLIHEIKEIMKEKLNSAPNHGGKKTMNWETIITTVVSAITPYAAALGTSAVSAAGSKFGESIFNNVQKLWEWIRQNIEGKGDEQDKQLWEDFKNNPARYKDTLAQTLLRLAPAEDATLRKNAQNLIQELYRLLDNYDNFTLIDLRRICSRLNVHWENEIPNPTTEALARWAANYARTRHKEQELVAAIFDINPDALPK
jgi:CheY-like chemotaxis protein